MKKTDTWMPLYIGDYLADTSRLTTEQHGAYLLLLMDYWRNGPPPDDEAVLASITKLAPAVWRKHATTLRGFFRIEDGRWLQGRAEAERAKANGVSDTRRSAGKLGAERRWADGKRDGKADGKPIANAMANASQEAWQNDRPSQSQSEEEKDKDPAHASSAVPPSRAAARAVEGQEPSPAGRMCRVIRQAGMAAVNPGDPRLIALVEQGATEAEFAGIAAEAVAKSKGFAWVLTVLAARRREAGDIALGPPPDDGQAAAAEKVETSRQWLEEQRQHAELARTEAAARKARRTTA